MKTTKYIRFVTPDYQDLFVIPDGGKIRITYPDREPIELPCKHLGKFYLKVDYNLFHIYEFAEKMRELGAKVEPVGMTVLVLEPGQEPYVSQIENNLKATQAIVGGFIEIAKTYRDGAILVCNEEGKLLDMEPNRPIRNNQDIIMGTAFICGTDEGDFTSLTATQIAHYSEQHHSYYQKKDNGDYTLYSPERDKAEPER